LPRGKPFGSRDLAALGVYPELAYRYVRLGWIQRLGRGTFQFAGDVLDRGKCLLYLSRLIPGFHVGGKTALAWHGYRHNVPQREQVELWGPHNTRLPKWFTERFPSRYTVMVLFRSTLKPLFGMEPLPEDPTGPAVSVPERALLEMLSQVGVHQELDEARHIMESTQSLRPETLHTLLRACTQIKAVRLCVAWGEELKLPWAEIMRTTMGHRMGKSRWSTRLKNGRTLILNP
jgi:hypothetical protein